MRLFVSCILFVMTTALAVPNARASDDFKARPVTETQVLKMLHKFRANNDAIRSFGEIAAAIAKASTEDPLFPHVAEGSEMTAAILVAIAWHESRFQRSAVGDHGRSFGLYQIQPPSAKIDSKMLTVPRSASFVAIDLVRKSIQHCVEKKRNWREALAWYAASSDYGAKHPKIVRQSVVRMETAAAVFADTFGLDDREQLGKLLSQKDAA